MDEFLIELKALMEKHNAIFQLEVLTDELTPTYTELYVNVGSREYGSWRKILQGVGGVNTIITPKDLLEE